MQTKNQKYCKCESCAFVYLICQPKPVREVGKVVGHSGYAWQIELRTQGWKISDRGAEPSAQQNHIAARSSQAFPGTGKPGPTLDRQQVPPASSQFTAHRSGRQCISCPFQLTPPRPLSSSRMIQYVDMCDFPPRWYTYPIHMLLCC